MNNYWSRWRYLIHRSTCRNSKGKGCFRAVLAKYRAIVGKVPK